MSTPLLIGYSVILLLAGVVAGYLWSSYRHREARTEEGDRSHPEESEAEPKGLLRSWQEAGDSHPVVELDGKRLSNNSDLTIEQQARLALLSATLQAWVEVREEPSPPSPPPAPPAPPTPPPSAPSQESARRGPIAALTKAVQADVRLPYKPTEIVAQVNEVLQKKLAESPLAGRPIRLLDIPGRGMVIYLGLETYTEIDAIPDETIRDLIHAAVAEWEQSSKPET